MRGLTFLILEDIRREHILYKNKLKIETTPTYRGK